MSIIFKCFDIKAYKNNNDDRDWFEEYFNSYKKNLNFHIFFNLWDVQNATSNKKRKKEIKIT